MMSYLRSVLAMALVLSLGLGNALGQASGEPVAFQAWFTAPGDQPARLHVRASLAPGWHTYSNTQSAGKPTRIVLEESDQFRQSGAFRSDVTAKVDYDRAGRHIVETHDGTVTWSAPLKLGAGVDPASLVVRGQIELLACQKDGSCQPVTTSFAAVLHQPEETTLAGPPPEVETFPTVLQDDPPFDDILPKELGGFAPAGGDEDKITVKASVTPAKGETPPQLVLEATIANGWHTYALDQPKGGPIPATIKITAIDKAQLAGPFTSDPKPHIHFSKVFEMKLHEHSGRVKWIAPLKLDAGAKASDVSVIGAVNAQVCDDQGSCLPDQDYNFKLGKISLSFGKYRARGSHVEIGGHVSAKVVAPGDTLKLVLTATPDATFHAYPIHKKPKTAKPTLIAVDKFPMGWEIGKPQPDKEPVEKEGEFYFEGPVAWTIEVKVPDDAKPGSYTLGGGVGYMVCQTDGSCDPPKGASFQVQVQIGSQTGSARQPLAFLPSNYAAVEEQILGAAALKRRAENRLVVRRIENALGIEMFSRDKLDDLTAVDTANLDIVRPKDSLSTVGLFLIFAFLGGLILNVMPCVLPVIGLKIMSFVQQGGESRARIFALNVWFSLGLISVFLILAAAAHLAGLGWGAQFQQAWFTVTLCCVVFAFALALLGVWEVPIPGFVGTGAANEMAAKEGPAGAFTKGVLTTILATPCTGPFLGPALAWAVKQPPFVIYATFAAVGLGMASPFLLIGAFPRLVAFLPKPGVWMETFKHLMGFVLLGTVVWLLSFLSPVDVVPAITVMCGLGLAFWWYGRTRIEKPAKKNFATVGAVVVTVLITLFSFGWLKDDVMAHRDQRRFESRMVAFLGKFVDTAEEHQPKERPPGTYTVMVDFTADW